MIAVVGGTYSEQTIFPSWDQLFGSGWRAACVISSLQGEVKFYTYLADSFSDDISLLAQKLGVTLNITQVSKPINFFYFHSLSIPEISPVKEQIKILAPIKISEDKVLRFGFMEGDAVVEANQAVYDPQSPNDPKYFSENGSIVESLAVIINRSEAALLTGEHDKDKAAAAIIKKDNADVVVIKSGSEGAFVYDIKGLIGRVPAFLSPFIWTLGSGDVFSAAYSYFWMQKKYAPLQSAILASKATAIYSNTRSYAMTEEKITKCTFKPVKQIEGQVYLAGPFFNTSQRWLIEEARQYLKSFGLKVFSPLHDVGRGAAEDIAEADLKGLKESSVVFACADGCDPGTIYEIGYARALGIPVNILAENVKEEDKKMIIGSGCKVYTDFVTAIYHTAWEVDDENGIVT